MGISRADIVDADIVDAQELASTGTVTYRSGSVVTSTNSGTKVVTFPGSVSLMYGDDPIEVGDKLVLSGTSAADGVYTVAAVLSDQTLTVLEVIVNSSGGSASFIHKAGASRIGIDSSGLILGSGSTLQEVISTLDFAVYESGLSLALLGIDGSFMYIGDGDILTKA